MAMTKIVSPTNIASKRRCCSVLKVVHSKNTTGSKQHQHQQQQVKEVVTMQHHERRSSLYVIFSLLSLIVVSVFNEQQQVSIRMQNPLPIIMMADAFSPSVLPPTRSAQRDTLLVTATTLFSSRNKNNDPSRQQQSQSQQQQQQQQQQQLSNQQGKREMIQSTWNDDVSSSPSSKLLLDDTSTIFTTNGDNTIVPILDETTRQLMECIVLAADGRKGQNIVANYIGHITTMTSILIVVSGNSRPQNQAICSAIRTSVAEFYQSLAIKNNNDNNDTTSQQQQQQFQQPMIEGTAESGWMILDYGNIMVHVMTPKSRLFYNVEGKWNNPNNNNPEFIIDPSNTSLRIPNTAIAFDLSHLLVPNTMATTSSTGTAQQQQQQQQQADQLYYNNDDSNDTKSFDNYDNDEEVEKEDELDPFWS